MSEWQGPFPSCVEHGLLDPQDFPGIDFTKQNTCPACGRILVPIERRRAPQPDAPVEALPLGLSTQGVAVALSGPYQGWVLIKHADGQWVTAAKLDEFSMGILANAALAAPRPERTYSAEEVQEAYLDGHCDGWDHVRGIVWNMAQDGAKAEAQRRWPVGERRDGEAGA